MEKTDKKKMPTKRKYLIAFLSVVLVIAIILLMVQYHQDKRAIALVAVVAAFITHLFSSAVLLISAVPIIGPLIIKVLSIPFFWVINALGYFTSAIAIKKGYAHTVTTHRLVTIFLLIGIIIGYILGHLAPLKN